MDNSIFEHGDFIELRASFKRFNNESYDNLDYGWKIVR